MLGMEREHKPIKGDYAKTLGDIIDKHKKETEDNENFLHYDFQGWPVTKKTLRELLFSLGAEITDSHISFDNNNPILDVYPETLEDDGMAYGINGMYFTDANVSGEHIYFWRDKKYKGTIYMLPLIMHSI